VSELQVILQHLQRTTIAASLKLKPQSPNEFFFGVQLPLVFEKHFKRGAKYSRPSNGGAPGGPFIRFAAAVASALDIKSAPRQWRKQLVQFGRIIRGAARMGKIFRPGVMFFPISTSVDDAAILHVGSSAWRWKCHAPIRRPYKSR
jgi:hypothetical protein